MNPTVTIPVNNNLLFDRKQAGGFAGIKEIKQQVRNVVAPEKSLGHSDKACNS